MHSPKLKMKKRFWISLILLLVIIITYFTGPKVPKPEYSEILPTLPKNLEALEAFVQKAEAQLPVREDNQARIIWNDEVPRVTEYSVIYLHGFAGSYMDGYPVNVQVADTLEANIYLSRWAGHGLIPPASLDNFSAETAWASAKEALVIGNAIGKKVIIVSTSTGGTLALKLAAKYPEKVHALINMAPYIEDDVDGAFILNSPWGYEIAKMVSLGEEMKIKHKQEIATLYWDTVYPSKALVDLQVLLGTSMTPETFKKISCPVLTLYYYENFIEEDEHVEVEVYPGVHELLSTPDYLKKLVRLKSPKTHFLGSYIKSKDTEIVLEEIVEFLKKDLGIDLNNPAAIPSTETQQ